MAPHDYTCLGSKGERVDLWGSVQHQHPVPTWAGRPGGGGTQSFYFKILDHDHFKPDAALLALGKPVSKKKRSPVSTSLLSFPTLVPRDRVKRETEVQDLDPPPEWYTNRTRAGT